MWAAAVGAGAGDKVPPPSVVRDDLDAMLTAASTPMDRDRLELRRALGVL